MKSKRGKTDLNPRNTEKKIFSSIKKKAQDKEAFIKAYDLYVDQIYRFIYFKVGNRYDEAQDITSAVFLKTWNYIQTNSLKDYKTLRALIYKIARTSVIDHYRKSSNLTLRIDDENNQIDIPDYSQDITKQAEINSDLENIIDKLQKLKDEYREIIVLRFINELSITEISKIINKSKGNARVLVHRALKALRDEVDDNKENQSR